jgi:hypothetical protein
MPVCDSVSEYMCVCVGRKGEWQREKSAHSVRELNSEEFPGTQAKRKWVHYNVLVRHVFLWDLLVCDSVSKQMSVRQGELK